MKKLILLLIIVLTGCLNETPTNEHYTATEPERIILSSYTGGVFKGPFLIGSTVTVYELDESLNQTGVSYSGDIISDDGTYDISDVELSGPVELVATGYYFDEIKGIVTNNTMTMRAITENSGVVNINLFTALSTDRITKLYNQGLSIGAAESQATSEILSAFGLSGAVTSNSPSLLAVSSLFAYGRSVADVQSLLTSMRVDLADGIMNVSDLTVNAKYINVANTANNLQNYYNSKGLDVVVPLFDDELWTIYGTDFVVADEGNYIQLSSEEVVQLVQGYGHLDGFIIPDGVTVSFTITQPSNTARFYGSTNYESFEVSGDTATATGPGYYRLDFCVLYPSVLPYNFSIEVHNGGAVSTVNYQVIE